MKIEAGKTYRISYGNGHQLFHIIRISKSGKPFGYRLHGGAQQWYESSLKVNDSRLIPGAISTGRTSLIHPPVPAPIEKKHDLRALEAEKKELSEKLDAMSEKMAERFGPNTCPANDAEREARTKYRDEWVAAMDARNLVARPWGALKRKLNNLKAENSLVAQKGDLESFGEDKPSVVTL